MQSDEKHCHHILTTCSKHHTSRGHDFFLFLKMWLCVLYWLIYITNIWTHFFLSLSFFTFLLPLHTNYYTHACATSISEFTFITKQVCVRTHKLAPHGHKFYIQCDMLGAVFLQVETLEPCPLSFLLGKKKNPTLHSYLAAMYYILWHTASSFLLGIQ